MKTKSTLVALYYKKKQEMLRFKIKGLICFPCGYWEYYRCGKEIEKSYSHVEKVIQLYTETTLDLISPLVLTQHKIFMQACTDTNKEIPSEAIFANIDLIDVICSMDSQAHDLVQSCCTRRSSFPNIDKINYMRTIYDKYKELGGDEEVVLYGMPEYFALVDDPVALDLLQLCEKFAESKSEMRNFAMKYKSAVFGD